MPVRSLSECLFEKTPCSVNIFLKKIIATLSGMEEKPEFLVVFFSEISIVVLEEMFSQ